MAVCEFCSFSSAWRALDKSFFNQIGFVHIFYRAGIFAHGSRDSIEADRSSAELIDDGCQQFVIYLVEAEGVDIECLECVLGHLEVYPSVAFDLGEIANAS